MSEGTKADVERKLLILNQQIFAITSRYHISSVEEMQLRYENGTLKEANSWDDFQTLDHLEYQRDQLLHLSGESYLEIVTSND